MTDPIERTIRFLFSFVNEIPDDLKPFFIVMQIMGVILLFCLCKKNFLSSEESREEKTWSDICGALTDRLSYLLPKYRQTLLEFASEYASMFEKNENLMRVASSVAGEAKERAEFDFCTKDAHRDEDVAMLQEQLEALLNIKKGGRNG